LLEVVKEISRNTGLPVIVQPNAGLPEMKEGKVFYSLDPYSFIDAMEPYFNIGVNIFGSCCGSTPEYTIELKKRVDSFIPVTREKNIGSSLASRENVVRIGGALLPKIVGERINPTARKSMAESLRRGDFGVIQEEAELQVQAGAHLLDVNVGTHGIDEPETMFRLINLLQQNIMTPFVIDSTNRQVIEKALQTYHGKALVNSVNGEMDSLTNILPLVNRYGAGIVGLTLDEKGIPPTAEERYIIAEKIVKICGQYGIPKEDIYIDCLALTVGTDDLAAVETLKTVKMVRERLHVNTILGISNVSYGLIHRSRVNAAFLAMAIANGLDLAIINPLDNNIKEAWQAACLLAGRDINAQNFMRQNLAGKDNFDIENKSLEQPSVELVSQLIIGGSRNIARVIEELLIQGIKPLEIINKGLIPGLNTVGEKFSKGEYYLPQLMLSAEIAQKAFDLLEKKLGNSGLGLNKGTIVIGTVKGDIHDIGKNMVSVILRNHGFKVVDLGKSVAADEFVKVVREENADFVALSALMTTTMIEIPETIKHLKASLPGIKVIVGGAVVTGEFAMEAGADGYGKDAIDAVKIIEKLRGK